MKILECQCGQAYIPSKTRDCHCGPKCCRDTNCQNAPEWRHETKNQPKDEQRRCFACRKRAYLFEAFAPCDPNTCKGGKYYPSSKASTNFPARYWQSSCHLYFDVPTWEESHHKPTEKSRVHISYCSLWCYNSLEHGHMMRARAGIRSRNRAYTKASGRTGAYYRQLAQQKKDGD